VFKTPVGEISLMINTDFHPDQFYKIHSSTEEEHACHRGKGPAGAYGAETSDCDTPLSLVNATFDWIAENIKDSIDFVVWTGDSARHDSDERIPRTTDQVISTNKFIANKFAEVFGNGQDQPDPTKDLNIPIIPTFGNNDILPHNIILGGPNKWLRSYSDIWKKFIPEEQRHGFERGGWFYTEVIPQKLAVFSLNTLYFFDHNAGVDGCAMKSEPGFEHMEWLRIQLQFMRERGMKAIMMGHVPPARTDSKALWDETCWQKYTLWLQQYRDVVVGGLFGHMNVDHFMFQDTKDINIVKGQGKASSSGLVRERMEDEFTITAAADYLEELRDKWSRLPQAPKISKSQQHEDSTDVGAERKKKKKKKLSPKEKFLKAIGGPWGERYQLSVVNPSIVPNYFPTIRVIEYNITGLDTNVTWASASSKIATDAESETSMLSSDVESHSEGMIDEFTDISVDDTDSEISKKRGKKHKKKKSKNPQDPNLVVPQPPPTTAPPGPAYSPQTLTLLGYTQYFANLTYINNDYAHATVDEVDAERWKEGKHKGKNPKAIVTKPRPFKFEVEYSTFNDKIYGLKDMTVRSYLKLAKKIGQEKKQKKNSIDADFDLDFEDDIFDSDEYDLDYNLDEDIENDEELGSQKIGKHDKNKVWLTFVKRAFVGTMKFGTKGFESVASKLPGSGKEATAHQEDRWEEREEL
jgi:endopolyphosphatase